MFRWASYGFLPKCYGSHAIIGNPPYQVLDGGGDGNSSVPIYHKFVELAKDLQPSFLSMIMPARWYAGGKGLDEFRQTMLQDKNIIFLGDIPDSRDCFPSVDIAGGICYFVRGDKPQPKCRVQTYINGTITAGERNLSEHNAFIRESKSAEIIAKVQLRKEATMNNIVFSRKPFGIGNSFRGKEEPFHCAVTLYGSQGLSYISREQVLANTHLIDSWKVVVSKASAQGGRADKQGQRKVIPKIVILSPGTVCTESYLLIAAFEDQQRARHLQTYIQTRFFRFLLALKAITQNISKESFGFVPQQSWEKEWKDKELYEKYSLSQDEIDYIESRIKAM